MNYYINPEKLGAVFMLPCEVVDKHIKLAGAVQLKVLLWAMRNIGEGITEEKIAAALSLPVVDVADALLYWTESGILARLGNEAVAAVVPAAFAEVKKEPDKPRRAVMAVKPSREEVIKRGGESEEIAFLLREAQMKFGRGLRANESSTLVWLHDDEGMNTAVILMLIEFAKSGDRCNIGYIEKTALSWINDGVTTLSEAEEKICQIHAGRSAWKLVSGAMGIDRRPSDKELITARRWVDEWCFAKDMLRAAYNKCVDSTGKFSMHYINKILEGWHKNGLKTLDDVENSDVKKEKKPKDSSFAGYDLSKVEEMLQNE